MAKSENENVYFPHYTNARNDRKIRRVRKELGVEGYGIFYMLLEVLREQSDLKYPMEDIDLLAEEFGTSEQKVRVVICNYALFEVDENQFFYSPKQIQYLQPYFAKSKRMKHLALSRWHGKDAYALPTHMPTHSDSNAHAMQAKQSKEKKSKEEQSKEPQKTLPVENTLTYHEQMAEYARKYGAMDGLTSSEIEAYITKRGSDDWEKPHGSTLKRITQTNIRHDMLHHKRNGWLKREVQTETTYDAGAMN